MSGTETITITPSDDKVVEGNETIIIPGTTTVTGLTVTSATITLKDHNGATDDPNDEDKADLRITGPTENVAEGSDAVFTVTLSDGGGIASDGRVDGDGRLGRGGRLGPLRHLRHSNIPRRFRRRNHQTITITATDDMLSEKAETFTVTLGAITTTLPATQVTLKTDDSTATATIAASDPITVSTSLAPPPWTRVTPPPPTPSPCPRTASRPHADLTVSLRHHQTAQPQSGS